MMVLIVGLGSIAKKHVDALYALGKEVTIYALRSIPTKESYKEVININDLKEIPGPIDFAIISNATNLHGNTIIQLLDYEIPLLIEKPVLSNLNQVSFISEQLKKRGIKTYVACNLRFHPGLLFLKQYLSTHKPRINEVTIYCGSYLPNWRQGVNFREIYSANASMGGGAHLDLIHEIDYCTWLFGFPESKIQLNRSVSSLDISAVDNARFMFCYPTFTVGINLNYYRKDIKRTIEIVSEEDTLLLDLVENSLFSSLRNEYIYQGAFNMLDTYKDQISYFIENLATQSAFDNDFDYASQVLQLVHE